MLQSHTEAAVGIHAIFRRIAMLVIPRHLDLLSRPPEPGLLASSACRFALHLFVHLRCRSDRSAPHFFHMRIVDPGLHFTINQNRFSLLQAGHVYLSASHDFFSPGIEPHKHLLAATVPSDSASS